VTEKIDLTLKCQNTSNAANVCLSFDRAAHRCGARQAARMPTEKIGHGVQRAARAFGVPLVGALEWEKEKRFRLADSVPYNQPPDQSHLARPKLLLLGGARSS